MEKSKDFMAVSVLEAIDVIETFVKLNKNVDNIYQALISHNYYNVVELCRKGEYDAARKIIKNERKN